MIVRAMGKRKAVPVDVRQVVLHECGYKCGNPACRYILTLDMHHIEYVSEGGTNTAENLLPLCGNCHNLHHRREIPPESIRAWKFLLLALNEALDRRSVDILLMLHKLNAIEEVTGDGLPQYAAMVSSGLASVQPRRRADFGGQGIAFYNIRLTEKGIRFVDGWLKGNQQAALAESAATPSTPET